MPEIIKNPYYRNLRHLAKNGHRPESIVQETGKILFGAGEIATPAEGVYEIVSGCAFTVGWMARGRKGSTKPILLSSAMPGDIVDTRLNPLTHSYLSDLFASAISFWSPFVVECVAHNASDGEPEDSGMDLVARAQRFYEAGVREAVDRVEKLFDGSVTDLQAGAALILALQNDGELDASKETLAQCTLCPNRDAFNQRVIKPLVKRKSLVEARSRPNLQAIDTKKLKEILMGSTISPDDFSSLRPLNKAVLCEALGRMS